MRPVWSASPSPATNTSAKPSSKFLLFRLLFGCILYGAVDYERACYDNRNCQRSCQYSIEEYEQNHSNIQEKLDDLKNLITRSLPKECSQEDATQALYNLYNLEMDLQKHTFIEDDVLIPAAMQLEKKMEPVATGADELSAREKEILVCVAQGMLNKEIADKFNLSIYTVITHRKNITRKTGVKTVAGLTVYALLNNLIDMNTIE